MGFDQKMATSVGVLEEMVKSASTLSARQTVFIGILSEHSNPDSTAFRMRTERIYSFASASTSRLFFSFEFEGQEHSKDAGEQNGKRCWAEYPDAKTGCRVLKGAKITTPSSLPGLRIVLSALVANCFVFRTVIQWKLPEALCRNFIFHCRSLSLANIADDLAQGL